jgi:phospholipid transport system substrate-binding protein
MSDLTPSYRWGDLMRIALAAALLLASTHLFAQPGYGQGDPLYEQRYTPIPDTPDQVVRRGIDRLSGFLMGAQNPSPQAIRAFLDREIAPNFDFAYMARWAAGPMYRRLSVAQRARMTAVLKDLFLAALAKNLGTYALPTPRIDVYPARASTNGRQATVHTRVTSLNGLFSGLNFRFYWNEQGWHIFDVSANGASAVAYYRKYFGEMFRRHGPEVVLR